MLQCRVQLCPFLGSKSFGALVTPVLFLLNMDSFQPGQDPEQTLPSVEGNYVSAKLLSGQLCVTHLQNLSSSTAQIIGLSH